MPLCSVSLIKLPSNLTSSSFLKELTSKDSKPNLQITARVKFQAIEAQTLDSTLLRSTKWDLLLFFDGILSEQSKVLRIIKDKQNYNNGAQIYTVVSGIPSKILNNYETLSKELDSKPAPQLKFDSSKINLDQRDHSLKSDSQNLEVSYELLKFAKELEEKKDARQSISMLNFLHFFQGDEAKEEYHKYGQVSSRDFRIQQLGQVLNQHSFRNLRSIFSGFRKGWCSSWRSTKVIGIGGSTTKRFDRG